MAEILPDQPGERMRTIARVELFTDANLSRLDNRLAAHFEDARYDTAGALLPGTQVFGTEALNERFGDIKDIVVEAEGCPTVSIAQMAALIQAGVYSVRAWAKQRDAAAALAEQQANQ